MLRRTVLLVLVLLLTALAAAPASAIVGEGGGQIGDPRDNKDNESSSVYWKCVYQTPYGLYALYNADTGQIEGLVVDGVEYRKKNLSPSAWNQKLREARAATTNPNCPTVTDNDGNLLNCSTNKPCEYWEVSGDLTRFCTTGFMVYRFYGPPGNDAVNSWSRTYVPFQTNCQERPRERLVSPVPHPVDGSSNVIPAGWSNSRTPSGPITYPGKPQVKKACTYEDTFLPKYFAKSYNGYHNYWGPPIEDEDKRPANYDYDFHKTAISIRASMWKAYKEHFAAMGGLHTRPGTYYSNTFNTLPDPRNSNLPQEITYYVGEDKVKDRRTTIRYGDGRPCSSPFDFIVEKGSTRRTYGMCWVGIGQDHYHGTVSDGKNVYDAWRPVAEPFYYTDETWIESNPERWDGLPPTHPAIPSSYGSIIAANLPPLSGKVNDGGKKQTKRVPNSPTAVRTGKSTTYWELGQTANCYHGTGGIVEVKEETSNPKFPALKIGATTVSGTSRAYVAGTEKDWVLQITRGLVSLVCEPNCNGAYIKGPHRTIWKDTLKVPSTWEACTSSNRTTCAYRANVTDAGRTRTYTLNYYKATRPGEKVAIDSSSPGRVYVKVCVPVESSISFSVDLIWSSTDPRWGGSIEGISGGGTQKTESCRDDSISIPGRGHTQTVGGPFLTR